ncbi:hypothetical protein VTI74DRAFT_6041 [Chaetomium olivicolor]
MVILVCPSGRRFPSHSRIPPTYPRCYQELPWCCSSSHSLILPASSAYRPGSAKLLTAGCLTSGERPALCQRISPLLPQSSRGYPSSRGRLPLATLPDLFSESRSCGDTTSFSGIWNTPDPIITLPDTSLTLAQLLVRPTPGGLQFCHCHPSAHSLRAAQASLSTGYTAIGICSEDLGAVVKQPSDKDLFFSIRLRLESTGSTHSPSNAPRGVLLLHQIFEPLASSILGRGLRKP